MPSRCAWQAVAVWALLAIAGALSVATGWLPADAARDVALTRGGPVLAFLMLLTVLAELADRAGVFDAAADLCTRASGGSTWRMFLLVATLGTTTTICMSLDTTAVLLTPVVIKAAHRLQVPALPFAMVVVWLANTASLLLPVSNLTNLLAQQREHISPGRFLLRMALPEAVAVTITLLYLGLLFRRELSTRYLIPPRRLPPDRWTFAVCTAACLALAPGVLLGLQPWVAAAPCLGAAAGVFAIRQRSALTVALIPWRIVLLSEGLFLSVSAIARHGFTEQLHRLAGTSTLRTAATAAVTSNGVNNLPAYLAIEPAVPRGNTSQLFSVLIGTNTGPLILMWGSLATLLWRERCRVAGLHISFGQFALIGLGGVPFVIIGSWAALTVSS